MEKEKNVNSVKSKKTLAPQNRAAVKKEINNIKSKVTGKTVSTNVTIETVVPKKRKAMLENSKYREDEVLRKLFKKGIKINPINPNTLIVPVNVDAKNIIGIKTKGKIDFLLNYCGYHLMYA